MVLESIVQPTRMEKHPAEMLLIGFFYSSLGLFLADYIFKSDASIPGVFITTLPLVIVMMNTVKFEEKKDLSIHNEAFLIKEHGKAISMFFYLFMGMVVSYSVWFTILPEDMANNLFGFQINTVAAVQSKVVEIAGKTTGGELATLEVILANNFMVLFFCILFSFIYGAGAIFILTLNASVIGVAVGSRVREYLASCAAQSHADYIYNYFNSSVSITFCYMFHGLFEICAYIVGALAGGIISVAVVNHDFRTREFWHIIITDSWDLIAIAILLLITGGFVEVFITPAICHADAINHLIKSLI